MINYSDHTTGIDGFWVGKNVYLSMNIDLFFTLKMTVMVREFYMDLKKGSEGSHLYIPIIQQTFERLGGDFSRLHRQITGNTINTSVKDKSITTKTILKLWENAALECRTPTFALLAGMDVTPAHYGLLGHVLLNCKCLRDGIEMVAQFKHLMLREFNVELSHSENEAFYLVDLSPMPAEAERHIIEFDIASIVTMSRYLMAPVDRKRLKYNKIQFRHQIEPTHLSKYEDFFGCPVESGCNQAGIFMDAHFLNSRLRGADPNLHYLLRKKLERLKQPNSKSTSALVSEIKQYLRNNMEPSFPTAGEVAHTLGLGLSTLKRKLRENGTNFQAIADRVRYKQAIKLLADQNVTVAETGFLLGFSSISSFSRTFKKWAGHCPTEYRALHFQ